MAKKTNNLADVSPVIRDIEQAWAAHYEALKPNVDLLDKISASYGALKSPSQYIGALKQIEAQNEKLQKQVVDTEAALKKLQDQYVKLAEAKRATNKQTTQESVDNAALNQQARQRATVISQVVGAYRQLSAQEAIAARNVQDIIARGRLATQTQRQYNAELNKAQREWQGLRTRIMAADEATGRWGRSSRRSIEGANQLLGALGVTLGAAGVAMLAKDIFDTTRELQSLDLALKQVTGSQEEAAATQLYLSKISEDYGVNIQGLTKSYIGFYAGAKNAIDQGKISAEEIQQIFASVAKAAGAMGLSAEQQQGAFLALQQMISKGNIQAEELRGQLSERLPGAFGILARSMGVTEQKLNKMLEQGQVLAADVLPAFAKELEKAYGIENLNRVETLNASVSRLGNAWTDFVRGFSEGDSIFATSIGALIDKLAEALQGATRILEGNEKERSRVLAAIREKSYKDQLQTYRDMEKLDLDYVAKKNIFFKQEIERLQEQVRINAEANAEIKRQAQSRYVPNAQEDLAINSAAIKAANNEIKSYYGRLAAGNKILEENNKKIAKNTELTKEQLKAIEDARRDKYDTRLAEVQLEQQVIDRTLNDEDQFYSIRIAALDKHFNKRIEILSLMYEEEVRRAGKNHEKQKQALIKFHSESLKEIENYNSRRAKLESLQLQPEEDLVDTFDLTAEFKKNKDASDAWLNSQSEAIDLNKQKLKELKKILDDFANGFVEGFFSQAGLPTLFDILSDRITGFGVDAKTTALAITEAFQEMYNFLNQASQHNFDLERDNLERKYNIDKEFANGNQAAIAELDKQAEARRREIARREAKANKELTLFNIGMNAAQGIVASFKDGNVIKGAIFAAIIGGIAVAQAAVVNSKSIPEYWKGTDNHPGGLMMVNDAKGSKYREIVETPDGKRFAPRGRNVIMGAPKGTKVFDAMKSEMMFDSGLNKILDDRGISMNAPVVNNVSMDIDKLGDRIDAAISRIPQVQFAPNLDAASAFVRVVANGSVSHNARKYQKPITYRR